MNPCRLRQAVGDRSLRKVARDAGLDEHTLRRALRGEMKRGLTVDTLERIARATGVDPGWLAFGEDEP